MLDNKYIIVFTKKNYHFAEILKYLQNRFQNKRPRSQHSYTSFNSLMFGDFATVCIYRDRFLRLPVVLTRMGTYLKLSKKCFRVLLPSWVLLTSCILVTSFISTAVNMFGLKYHLNCSTIFVTKM